MKMWFLKNPLRTFLLWALLPVFAVSSNPARAKADVLLQINYDPVKETVSQLIGNEMKKNDVTGLSIALVDGQKVVWAQGFGYADEDKNIAASPDTVYRIGTLTKLFTATATMQLAGQNKLAIDKPLKKYLPEFSIRTRFSDTKPITLRNLMTHHSGLPSDFQKGTWSRKPGPFTEVTNLIKDEYAAYPPGFIFSYSKIGYDLLGHVIEHVSGQDYALHIQGALLYPLGMRNSGFTPPAVHWFLSKGYYRGTETEDPPLRDLPAGGMYSTVLDLGRFMEMIFANGESGGRQIIAPKTLAEMFRPQNANVPLDLGLRVGLGWMLGGLGEIDIKNAGTVAHHAGATQLFRSQMIVLPNYKLGVVVLANSSTAGRTLAKVAAQTLELALEAKTGIRQPFPEKPVEVDMVLPQEVRRNYAGRYASIAGIAEIVPRSDHFHVEAVNRTFQLVPHANGKFGIKYVLLGLFPFNLGALEYYEVSYERVSGREILKASTKGSNLLIAEKIHPISVSGAWLKRVGKYSIENMGDDVPIFENIRLRYEEGLLLLECSMPFFFKGPLRFPLTLISDTEAVLAGLGRGMGETIRVVIVNGNEMLSYSGYLLKMKE